MNFHDIDFHPDARTLRTFAVLWLIGFGLLGLLAAWRGGALASGVPIGWHAPWRAPIALWVVASLGSALGLAWPAALRPIYVGWMVAVFPIGWTVSLVLLALVYFVLFTLVALVFRLLGRDPLARSFDRGAESYWVRRSQPGGNRRYFDQF